MHRWDLFVSRFMYLQGVFLQDSWIGFSATRFFGLIATFILRLDCFDNIYSYILGYLYDFSLLTFIVYSTHKLRHVTFMHKIEKE